MTNKQRVALLRRVDDTRTATDEDRLRDLLRRLVKWVSVVLVAFVVIYWLGQRHNHVPNASLPNAKVAAAEAAVRAKPNDIQARLSLADAYVEVQRQDDALAQLQEVLKAVPDNRSALLGAGSILYQQGKVDEAKVDIEKFIAGSGQGEFASADPQLERAYYVLGLIQEKKGDHVAAVGSFEQAVTIDAGDADAWYALGNARGATQDHAGAIQAYTEALAFVPTGWCEPYRGLATSYGAVNDREGKTYADAMSRVCAGGGLAEAKPLEQLVDGKLGVVAMLGLGAAAENDHEFAVAADWYRKVLKREPGNLAAKGGLGRSAAVTAPSGRPSPSSSAS